MANTIRNDHDQDRVWSVASAADFCMLVTMDGKQPWGRPMGVIARKDEGKVFMLTDKASIKDNQISRNPSVLLLFNRKPDFLSLRGKARLRKDRETVRDLWSPGAQAFWPDGPEDASVIAIEVTPQQAELWEGDNALVSTVKFAWAIATRQTARPGQSKKLTFSARRTARRPAAKKAKRAPARKAVKARRG
ncbi:MAG: pyridoxamine 5'-phosphate oxidase family protein [Rhizobiales bacterium]|nr:pyridoxamine 5'-phosphate oxidase family protein [Hyphomicrobiales bacterium]